MSLFKLSGNWGTEAAALLQQAREEFAGSEMVNTTPPKTTRRTARKKTSASRPTSASGSHIFTKYIGSLEIKPRQQSHMSLGLFNPARPAKGFLVNVSPDPIAPDSVTTQITSLGNARHYELILRVANYGDQKLQAEIWEL